MLNPNKIRQLLALLITLAGVSLVAVISLKVYREKPMTGFLPRLPGNIEVSLQKIHYTETRHGIKKWDILADKAEYDKDHEVTHLTGIKLILAGNRSTGDITLVSDRADYYNKTKDVHLKGHVTAESASGMRFLTDEATYLAAQGVILAPGRVKFSDRMLSVEGVGMEYMSSAKKMKLSRDVAATVSPEAGSR